MPALSKTLGQLNWLNLHQKKDSTDYPTWSHMNFFLFRHIYATCLEFHVIHWQPLQDAIW